MHFEVKYNNKLYNIKLSQHKSQQKIHKFVQHLATNVYFDTYVSTGIAASRT